ncbi:hypothetical protein KPH14_012639, partial [Odynerus spinipes]
MVTRLGSYLYEELLLRPRRFRRPSLRAPNCMLKTVLYKGSNLSRDSVTRLGVYLFEELLLRP